MVIQLKSQPRVIPVNINGTIMVKLALEIHDVTIQACSQGTTFESAKNQSFYIFLKFVNHLSSSALSTPCPADKQFCVTERQVEWIGRGNQIHTSKRYCSNREYTPTGDNTGQKLHRYLTVPLKLSTEKINNSHFLNLEGWFKFSFRRLSTSIIIKCCLQGLFCQLQWQGSWKC